MTINMTREAGSVRSDSEIGVKALFVTGLRARGNLSAARSVDSARSTVSNLEIKPLKSDLNHPFLTQCHTDLTTADSGP